MHDGDTRAHWRLGYRGRVDNIVVPAGKERSKKGALWTVSHDRGVVAGLPLWFSGRRRGAVVRYYGCVMEVVGFLLRKVVMQRLCRRRVSRLVVCSGVVNREAFGTLMQH